MNPELTDLLNRWRSGDVEAEAIVVGDIYPVLRALAHRQLSQRQGYTLQPTELAHEAYLRLAKQHRIDWQNRGHFLAIAGRVVRRVVIDYLRERHAQKRGGEQEILSLHDLGDSDLPATSAGFDWLRLDVVLTELEAFDPEGARLVELRYFAGLTVPEIASSQGVSESTVARQWRVTRAWLQQRLADVVDQDDGPK